MINRARFWLAVVTLSLVSVFVPATASGQHGPARHAPGAEGPAYDTNTEATFTGTITDVRTGGRGKLGWLLSAHTMGLGHQGPQDTQVVVKTDTDSVLIHLGPTAFLNEKNAEFGKGDTLQVTGSLIAIGGTRIVLARDVRKGDNVWVLRDAGGQPLWNSSGSEPRRFWTTKKIVLAVVIAKVVLLATVLRH